MNLKNFGVIQTKHESFLVKNWNGSGSGLSSIFKTNQTNTFPATGRHIESELYRTRPLDYMLKDL